MVKIAKKVAILLACICLIGCANSTGNQQPTQQNQKESEPKESEPKESEPEEPAVDEKEIQVLNFWIENGSYDKESKTLEFNKGNGEWQSAYLYTEDFEIKGQYICFEYEILHGLLKINVNYKDNTGTTISCNMFNKVYLPLDESKTIESISLINAANYDSLKVTIKKFYYTDETEEKIISDPIVDSSTSGSFNNTISSIDLVKDMAFGLNLANYFDAWSSMKDEINSCLDWGSPLATEEMIKSIGTCGAKTIRIPVTWFNHIIDDKYTIDPEWMKMVKQVVDWAYDEGYYVVLNSHHDVHENMQTPLRYHEGYQLTDNDADIVESERFLKAVWTQICKAFNNSYDEHLIFETMNEPRSMTHCKIHWDYAESCADCDKYSELNNQFNQLCLDTIRASGGNNAKRFVLIPTVGDSYLAACDDNGFKMPSDSVSDKLILTLHWYPLGDHLWKTRDWDYSNMEKTFIKLNEGFIEKGIPIVFGEIGPTALWGEDEINAFGHKITEEEAYPPCSDLTKFAAFYGMSVLEWTSEFGINNLPFAKRLADDWKAEREIAEKEAAEKKAKLIDVNAYYLADGDGTYDSESKILKTSRKWADFSINECSAKGQYICIEYEILAGGFFMRAIYDDGDNDYYNEGNPEDGIDLDNNENKVCLELKNITSSKKLKVEILNSVENSEIRIDKIYFTDIE